MPLLVLFSSHSPSHPRSRSSRGTTRRRWPRRRPASRRQRRSAARSDTTAGSGGRSRAGSTRRSRQGLRSDDRARRRRRGRHRPRRARLSRADELRARRSRRQRRPVGRGSRRPGVGAGTEPDHAARRDVVRGRPRRSSSRSSATCGDPVAGFPSFSSRSSSGSGLLTNGIKELLDRVRPTLESRSRRRSARRSRAGTRRRRRRSGPRPPSFSAAAVTRTAAHCSPVARPESQSPSPAHASSSTCTGSPTPSPGSSSAGRGSPPAHRVRRALPPFGAAAEEAVHEADLERRRVAAQSSA